jgi:hypothetical protein
MTNDCALRAAMTDDGSFRRSSSKLRSSKVIGDSESS